MPVPPSAATPTPPFLTIDLPDEAATAALGAGLAALLNRAGDVVALHGPMGAGKSALSRAIIRALRGPDTEVPSPTFTLVQIYETPVGPVWHYDLYRIGHPDELDELGWDDALTDGITLVEWPERAGRHLPDRALTVTLTAIGPDAPSARQVEITGGPEWRARLAGWNPHPGATPTTSHPPPPPTDAVTAFLAAHGWEDATRQPLSGDASGRTHTRLISPDGDTILLTTSPNPAADITRFAEVAALVEEAGLRAPEMIARDEGSGIALQEDLGDRTMDAALLSGDDPRPLYELAVDVLVALHRHHIGDAAKPPCPSLPAFDTDRFVEQVGLFATIHLGLDDDATAALGAAWREALTPVCDTGPWSLILRDYHPGNIMLTPGLGLTRAGLIDLQDAGPGPVAYDLMSLLEDARRDVPDELAAAMIARYLDALPHIDRDHFHRSYAVLAAVRHARVLAIFQRLARDHGKAGYMAHAPRVRRLLARALADPALAPVRAWLERNAPDALDALKNGTPS